jgi:nucleotide-binding universal stress UspA family protein
MPGIIVGVDGSAHSRWALEWAMSEAVARHARLTVLSVPSPGTAVTITDGDLNLDQACEEVQELVDQAVSRRPGPALPVTVQVTTGSPAAALIGAARDADLLVLGARGSGGLQRRGVGSVSSQVADEARCPVVIIFRPAAARLRAGRAAAGQTRTHASPPLAGMAAIAGRDRAGADQHAAAAAG